MILYNNLFQLMVDLANQAKENNTNDIYYYEYSKKLLLGWSINSILSSDYNNCFMIKLSNIQNRSIFKSLPGISETTLNIFTTYMFTRKGRNDITDIISVLSQCSEITSYSIERIINMKAFW